jgi:hypothetical protein
MFPLGSIALIIVATFIVALVAASFVAIRTALDYAHRPKPTSLDTDLKVFKESQTVDKSVERNGQDVAQSTAMVFENMCVLDPVDSEDLKEVALTYKKYLKGELIDMLGTNAPLEFINGERNPDYKLYLLNQKKALAKKGLAYGWVSEELKRINDDIELKEIATGFLETLMTTYQFPVDLLPYAVNDYRMENFSEKQWSKFAQVAREYTAEFDKEAICAFFLTIEDYSKLVDYSSMERFASWHEHGVPDLINKANIMGGIPDDLLFKIVRLVDEESFEWNEAFKKVLDENIKLLTKEELRKKYRSIVDA